MSAKTHHIATIAARALSCDVALIRAMLRARSPRQSTSGGLPLVARPGAEAYLSAGASGPTPLVDQAAQSGAGEGTFGRPIASSMVIRLGSSPSIGALALAHASSRPRGFTSLCQRIGRAMSEAAELLISQAVAREQLGAEFELMAQISRNDPLTGIANRRLWDESANAVLAEPRAQRAMVLSCDLDGLKAINDRYGHAAGDALIRATATLLTTCVRASDLVARLGGDEFAVLLLRDSDAKAAGLVRRRIRGAEQERS